MKFNIAGGEASFFKILLRDTENYLPLPPAFAKNYLEKRNVINEQEVVLETKSGEKWSVKYFKIEDRYYFMDGWLDFMKDNRLHYGDFIVFWHHSSSPKLTFQVFPYAPNGCLKYPCSSDDAAAAHGRGPKKPPVKEESSDVNESSENTQQSTVSVVVKKSYTGKMPLRKRFLKANGADGYGSVRLRDDKGKTWNLSVTNYGPSQTPYLTAGWSEFRKSHSIMIGNTCEFRHIKGNLFDVRVLKTRGGN